MIISDGTRTVWSRSAERCQLRDMLRYQLMLPVKPDFVKVSTKTFFSSGARIGVRGSCLASYPAIICGNARLSLGEAPTPATGGSAGVVSLRGTGFLIKKSKGCSTRLLNILSALWAGS